MFIYIPLCLYLYDISTPPVNSYYTIYIPLCLYLYEGHTAYNCTDDSFTFHYASTYTHANASIPSRGLDLHSTMPLLIPNYSSKCISQQTFTFHYASTYTNATILTKRRCLQFTFHYASTYTRFCRWCSSSILIYIPLCLYLYLPGVGSGSVGGEFTFHYASTYTFAKWLYGYVKTHLHSTMPLLIPAVWSAYRYMSVIYIPLCLYLYGCAAYTALWHYRHLHSTMPLLIRHGCALGCKRHKFTFHYASTYTNALPSTFFATVFIYIPLCLYLYQFGSNDNREVSGFTFHYASTYTGESRGNVWHLDLFTFHYASTYTTKHYNSGRAHWNLHSTMPLLIPIYARIWLH